MSVAHESARRLALADFAGAPEVVAFSYADGPSGIRGALGATAFPGTLALAATADPELAEAFGRAMAHELFAAGHNVWLGPGLDITRDPRAGRMGESMGEDPLLVGELAGRAVRGAQAEGALCVLKHFLGNSVERLRTGTGTFRTRTDAVDVRIGEAALHEIYLAPFRRAIERHGALALMGSYNRLNGEYTCQQSAIMRLPREQWGFTGITIPDFIFAVRDPAAALAAGLDLPGLEGAAGRTEQHLDAVDPALVQSIGDRVAGVAAAVGLRPATGALEPAGLGTDEHLALAERILVEGSVLLRNEGALPLTPGTRVALIGPDPQHLMVIGGSGSAALVPERIPALADALRDAGLSVTTAAGSLGDVPLPVVRAEQAVSGIRARLTDEETGRVVELDLDVAAVDAAPEGFDGAWSAELSLRLRLDADGPHRLSLEFGGDAELLVDGAVVATGFREASPMIGGPAYPLHAAIDRAAGDEVEVLVRYRTGAGLVIAEFGLQPHVRLGVDAAGARLAEAAAVARDADVAIVITGRVSGEAMDVDDLRLPGDQERLIAAVAGAAPRTVVVTASANPVVMPWRYDVDGILHVWQPGERLAPALAAIVTGAAEPGGRLPVTVPDSVESIPIASNVDPAVLDYAEGSLVGYRGYAAAGVDPAYPFGHGLGYAAIELEVLSIDARGATVRLRCGDDRGGKAVVQLYGRAMDAPAAALCGWQVARLTPGEHRELRMALDAEALAQWDPAAGRLIAPTGAVELRVGLSSTDVRGTAVVELGGDA